MAERGICSRRGADKLLKDGKIKVNGLKAELGEKVNSEDIIEVEGKIVNEGIEEKKYIILNKPKVVISAVKDDRGRKTVIDLVDVKERIYPIGRLDYETEGLILLTNDGELFNKIIHPKSEVFKTYVAKVKGNISNENINKLIKGVELDDGPTLEAKVRLLKIDSGKSLVEISIREGRNRQVRRMFDKVGHRVEELERISIGDINLKDLGRGQWRELTSKELEYLMNL